MRFFEAARGQFGGRRSVGAAHARAIFSAFLGLAFALGLAVVVFIVAVELWGRDAVLAPLGFSAKVDDEEEEEDDGAAPPPLRDGAFPVATFEPAGAPPKPRPRRRRAARRAKRRPAGAPAPAPDPDAPALSCWVGCFQPGDDDALRALGPATVSVSAADDDADFARRASRARDAAAERRHARASALF